MVFQYIYSYFYSYVPDKRLAQFVVTQEQLTERIRTLKPTKPRPLVVDPPCWQDEKAVLNQLNGLFKGDLTSEGYLKKLRDDRQERCRAKEKASQTAGCM